MPDESPHHASFLASTSFRLAVGFGTVLLVLASVLVADLYFVGKLEQASRELRMRQQIRRQTMNLLRTGELALESWDEDGSLSPQVAVRFELAYSQMAYTVKLFGRQYVKGREWVDLNRLARTAGRLRDVFRAARPRREYRPSESQSRELHARAVALVEQLNSLNRELGKSFGFATYRMEEEARWLRILALNITRAIFGLALVLSLVVVYLTHRSIMRPIKKLIRGTRRLAGGDLSSRIELPRSREFRELARSFNRMAESIEGHQKQLIEAEKLATLGRFAAGIAHEINNPIAVILGYAKTLLGRIPEDSPQREALQTIEEEARHCKRIVQDLLDLSRPPGGEPVEPLQPRAVVDEVLGVARVLKLTEEVELEVEVTDEVVPLPFGESRLRQVLLNLVTNALEAVREAGGGRLRVEGHLRNGPESTSGALLQPSQGHRRFLALRITDTGCGVPPEQIRELSEPFFTTKEGGTGLGLSITYGIVETHGGFIDVESNRGEGTTFVVNLPLREETAE